MDNQKLDQLKQNHPIKDIAVSLGINVRGGGGTVAANCFNAAAHPNGDRNPSLVLQPDTNTFECKSCGVHGDVIKLIELVKGIDFKEAVLSLDPNFYPPKVENVFHPTDYLEYWKSRGISEETKTKFGLTLTKSALTIPLGDGRNKYRQFLSLPKYKNPIGNLILFKTSEAKNTVFLVESELDAIKLHQEIGEPVWSSTGGAKTFKDEWVKDFEGVTKIYLCYDSDTVGKEGALLAARKLGTERCYLISLPQGKDVTEYFVKHNRTKQHFLSLIEDAVKVQPLHTFTPDEDKAFDFGNMSDEEILKKRDKTERLRFGIPKMDEGKGKIELPPGFTVIAAPQGVGKSWMMLYLSRVFYFYYGKKSVILSLEMSVESLKERALQSFSHLTQEQYDRGADVSEGVSLLKESGLVLREFGIQDASLITPEELTNIVEHYYNKGHRVFFFDHLHQIAGMSDQRQEKEVSQKWAMTIRSLCSRYKDLWFIAFAQTTKDAARKVVTKEGIRFGVRFVDVCDMFFSLNKVSSFIEAKNLAKANLEEVYNPTDNRSIFIYLGKNRLTDVQSAGWSVFLSRTGNFTQEDDEDVQPDHALKFTNVPKTFGSTPINSKQPEASKTVEEMSFEEVEKIFL